MASVFRPVRPNRSTLDRFLARAETRPLSYAEVGMTRGPAPEGYRTRVSSRPLVADAFERAAEALFAWRGFDIPWVVLYPDRPVIREGLTVIVAARTLGIWTLNPARIVARWEDDGDVGFAYGTVQGHAARGEERFRVARRPNGEVRYEITAFSRLDDLLVRAAGPVSRWVQGRFAAASLAAMQTASTGEGSGSVKAT